MAEKFATVEQYIASFPEDVQQILREIRRRLLLAVPGAEEKIRYDMPAVILDGRYAIHYAAWKKHIGLYPVPRLDEALEREIAPYRAAKDSVNFAYARPVDFDLIERMARSIVALRRESLDPAPTPKARTQD